ncbi:SDR family NAD(P)-dependent oxidoreductase [Steroidobacter flavus]|uniref:SDR family NAD(P)-dependent oxidoreductase n=1 Tax=Steroidobacter flavus TaxID=1842136 RepID=A0ABV8T512_9GAMM
MLDLSGKVALVTGASSGLGRHFAQVLARAGASVVVAARRAPLLEALVATISGTGGRAAPLVLDVSSTAEAIESGVAQAVQCFGHLDILINNSGVTVSKPVLDQTSLDWDTVINTNLRGAFFMSQSVARYLRAAGRGGCIVNVASILGLRQAGMVAPYAASKAALIQLTKTMALELARYSIRVNALAPGYIASDLNSAFFETDAGQALIRRIPQRHLGEPSDLDGALLLLCSDASRYMTGSVITVDGGHVVSTL